MFSLRSRAAFLHVKLLRILWFALAGAVRALEGRPSAHLGHRFECDDVPAAHHHWRIFVGCLLFRNWADKDGMEVIRGWQGYLDL